MKIFIPSSYFPPEQFSGAPLGNNRYQALADENIEMLMYTPIPTRGVTSEIRNEYKKHKRRELMFDNKMEVVRFSLMKEGKNPLGRALRYTIQCFKQFSFGSFSKKARSCDIMFISSTPPIQGAMAALIKCFNRIPIVYNLQDIFPDSLAGTGLAKKDGILWKIGRKVENFTYRNADKIIVISEDFKRNIMAKGVPEEKIEVIYNWVDENAVVPISKADNTLFEEFGIARDKFTIVYAGNLGYAQNIEIILDAAKELKEHEDIQFVVFGTGGLEVDFRKRIEQDGLYNVKLLPLQPYDRVSYVYGLGDACIVSCKPGLGGSAMPSKTWSIMSSGRAVLANFDEGDLKNIIEKNGCGIFTKVGNLNEFVNAIETLAKSPNQCLTMGIASRKFILENLTKAVGTKKTVDVVKSVLYDNKGQGM